LRHLAISFSGVTSLRNRFCCCFGTPEGGLAAGRLSAAVTVALDEVGGSDAVTIRAGSSQGFVRVIQDFREVLHFKYFTKIFRCQNLKKF